MSILLLTLLAGCLPIRASDAPSGTPQFQERVYEEKTSVGIRIVYNAPLRIYPDRPTLVVFYATPNGNTIEQTMGYEVSAGLDWHYDIQHVVAQVRRFRELDKKRNIILACMEAENLNWPRWCKSQESSDEIIRDTIEHALNQFPGDPVTAILAAHSGGGSMIFSFINACHQLPGWVERIVFLDANYAYSDQQHGDKLVSWLSNNPQACLVVLAYDDRRVTLDGKTVVGRTGGTYRATHRMLNRFEKCSILSRKRSGAFDLYTFRDYKAYFWVHPNPENKILHTALVGEMNGLLHALTVDTEFDGRWGRLGGPRAYTEWIQPPPILQLSIPKHGKHPHGGSEIMRRVSSMSLTERENVLESELLRGNIPDFLTKFKSIQVHGKDLSGREHVLIFFAMPDYLAIGTDSDYCRVPMTPVLAQRIADQFNCTLPTRKMVDEIHRAASIKLEPRALTQNRESVKTFIEHNSIIETLRGKAPLGSLISGIKKDVVITPLIEQRPDHVAIYGWHKLDGTPIQPLTTVHINSYVDYSHGVRLVKRGVLVDGNPVDIREVLADPILHPLVSDEGPIKRPYYWAGYHPPSAPSGH